MSKNILIKVLLILFASLILSSCWSSTDETQTEENNNSTENVQKTGLRNYPWKDFSIKIPAAWNIITENKEIVPNPNNWKMELAITSPDTKNGFANNLIILSQKLEKFTTSKDYSIINNTGAENEYLNYFKKSVKEFSFSDWEESMIYNFEAKYEVETPTLQFLQTAHICNNTKAFFITIALPLDIKDTSKYEKMIATFECK